MGAEFIGALAARSRDALGAAGQCVSGATALMASAAGEAVGFVTGIAGNAAGKVAQGAGGAASVMSRGAGKTAAAAAETAEGVAHTVAATAGGAIGAIKERSPENVVKRAKVTAFKDGINEGASLMAEKAYAYSFALVAVTMYVARCDGDVACEEVAQLRANLRHLCVDENVPQAVKDKLNELASNEGLSFDDVAAYLNKLGLAALEDIELKMDEAIEADGRVTPEEEAVRLQFKGYMEKRQLAGAGEDE